MRLPDPDPDILARRVEIVAGLTRLLGERWVIAEAAALAAYDCDALTAIRQLPLAVALPGSAAEAASVLKFCQDQGVNVVPRGAGTSLSGGSTPLGDGVTIGLRG